MKILLLLAVAGATVGLVIVMSLPALISALPSQVRGRLPEDVIRAVTTPLPTALPAPIRTAAVTPISIADLLPTSTATNPPMPSASPTMQQPVTPQPSKTAAATTVAEVPTETPAPTATMTASPTVTLTPSPQPLAESVRITGLSVVPQKFNNCGSANMSVMLDYYGVGHSQTDIAQRIKPHYDDRNVTPEELVSYVNEQTELQAAAYRGGDIDLLRTLINAGFPVIVEKGYEPDAWQGWMGHYLTLIGYDDEAQQFISLDTYLGPWDSSGRPITYEELDYRWTQFNNTFLVVHRPFEADEIDQLLGPAYTDMQQMWRNAAAKAELATAEEPGDAFAWYNLGASLTGLAEMNEDSSLYEAAAAAFDQSRLVGLPPRMLWYHFDPYKAYIFSDRIDEALALASAVMSSEGGYHVEESHFYQGLAFKAAGDKELARNAFKRALDIRPSFPAAQAQLDALSGVIDYSSSN